LAVSFQGLPCPVCGRKTANAVAYPPYYKLRCFDTNCPASETLPLFKWAGIKITQKDGFISSPKIDFPTAFEDLQQARNTIREELENHDDVLFNENDLR